MSLEQEKRLREAAVAEIQAMCDARVAQTEAEEKAWKRPTEEEEIALAVAEGKLDALGIIAYQTYIAWTDGLDSDYQKWDDLPLAERKVWIEVAKAAREVKL